MKNEEMNYPINLFKLLVDASEYSVGRINFFRRAGKNKELREYYVFLNNLMDTGEQYARFFPIMEIPLKCLKNLLRSKLEEDCVKASFRMQLKKSDTIF